MRELTGKLGKLIATIAIIWSLFELYTNARGLLPLYEQRGLLLIFTFFLAFILYPASQRSPRGKPSILDLIFAGLSILVFSYVVANATALEMREVYVTPVSTVEIVFGVIAIFLVLEATRRVIGLPMVIVTLGLLLYVYFGPWFPGILVHPGYSPTQIIECMYLSFFGIFGTLTGLAATYVFLFVLFGAFLEMSKTGDFFIDLSKSVAGSSRGGPAKVCVFGNALFGTLSGSPTSAVYTIGSFSIPMMENMGYSKEYAGGVAAAAATGGIIMPPVMGAVAFIMADWLGVSYWDVCIMAFIPACLYYLSLFVAVHLRAARLGLKGLPREKLPSLRKVLYEGGHLFAPMIALVYLLILRYSPIRSALIAILVTVIAASVRRRTRMGVRSILKALELGGKYAVLVTVAMTCAGIIIGAVNATGLGLTFTYVITRFAGQNLLMALTLSMVACLILGMGIPTMAAYIIVAALGVPALTELGVSLFAAHMFVLYFSIIAMITPPVAVAAFAAGAVARADPMKVGVDATRLAIAGFIVPFAFAYSPVFLLIGDLTLILISIPASIVGICALACSIEGYLFARTSILERVILGASAILLIIPEVLTDILGVGLLAVALTISLVKRKKSHVDSGSQQRSTTKQAPVGN